MDRIFLDYHSTSPLYPEVWDVMRPFFVESFGNPSSAHQWGRKARQALEDARERIAALLHANADGIYFTSGATEANNLALFGLIGTESAHILANPGEHPCVVEPLKQLAQRGHRVEWLPVDTDGFIAVETIQARLREDTRLLSVMQVNHETGTIQKYPALKRSEKTIFHSDAAQACGKMPLDFQKQGLDAMTISAHKFHGPKGIGALILRPGVKLDPLLFGGHQQRGKRPGTEAVGLAVGMATALEIAHQRMEISCHRVTHLKQTFVNELQKQIAPMVVNSPQQSSPYVVNIGFPHCRAEMLLMKLDLAGVACSTGSACSSGSLLPSPVLQSMNVPKEVLHSSMRFSFDPAQTPAEIARAATIIAQAVREIREDADTRE